MSVSEAARTVRGGSPAHPSLARRAPQPPERYSSGGRGPDLRPEHRAGPAPPIERPALQERTAPDRMSVSEAARTVRGADPATLSLHGALPHPPERYSSGGRGPDLRPEHRAGPAPPIER